MCVLTEIINTWTMSKMLGGPGSSMS